RHTADVKCRSDRRKRRYRSATFVRSAGNGRTEAAPHETRVRDDAGALHGQRMGIRRVVADAGSDDVYAGSLAFAGRQPRTPRRRARRTGARPELRVATTARLLVDESPP